MSREIAERCDLCGEYRQHTDLVPVHVRGELVDVCSADLAEPISKVLAAAERLRQASKGEHGPGPGE